VLSVAENITANVFHHVKGNISKWNGGKTYYFKLFNEDYKLKSVDHDLLPATTLSDTSCYAWMFNMCYNLTNAPDLPATTLSNYCYNRMFRNCSSLEDCPSELPATTLTDYCYEYMFNDCIILDHAPKLPAMTCTVGCYHDMFNNVLKLTTAPDLPATELAENCYRSMLVNCPITKAPDLPAATLKSYCYRQMFQNCPNLTYVKCLATNISAHYYTYQWLYYFGGTLAPTNGTFVKASGVSWPTGISGIPEGWTVIEEDVQSSNSLDDEDELIEAFSDDIDEITTTIDSSMMPDPSTNL